jgi:hypothetical protein
MWTLEDLHLLLTSFMPVHLCRAEIEHFYRDHGSFEFAQQLQESETVGAILHQCSVRFTESESITTSLQYRRFDLL